MPKRGSTAVKTIMFIIALTVSTTSYAYDYGQTLVLKTAHEIGTKIGFPETIQAICLQETIAGRIGPIGDLSKPIGKKSYGVMQIKVATAKDIIRWNPSMFRDMKHNISDEEIMIRLIQDDEWNILVGTMYFDHLYKLAKKRHYRHAWRKAVLSYNRGFFGNGDPNQYTRKVIGHIKQVRVFNRAN